MPLYQIKIIIKEYKTDEFVGSLRSLLDGFRKENGCLDYSVYQDFDEEHTLPDKPKTASLAVKYRGYWFFIEETDQLKKYFFQGCAPVLVRQHRQFGRSEDCRPYFDHFHCKSLFDYARPLIFHGF